MRKWLLLFVASFPPVSHAALINFNPAEYNAAAGDTLTARIFISGVPTGVAVGAFDLTVAFDPSLLVFQGFVFSNSLGDPEFQAFSSAVPVSNGEVEATLISFLSPAQLAALQGSSFELGEITLFASRVSPSRLSISGLVSDASGNPLEVTFQGALVNGTVPEPGSLSLGVSALAAVFLWGRRRSA